MLSFTFLLLLCQFQHASKHPNAHCWDSLEVTGRFLMVFLATTVAGTKEWPQRRLTRWHHPQTFNDLQRWVYLSFPYCIIESWYIVSLMRRNHMKTNEENTHELADLSCSQTRLQWRKSSSRSRQLWQDERASQELHKAGKTARLPTEHETKLRPSKLLRHNRHWPTICVEQREASGKRTSSNESELFANFGLDQSYNGTNHVFCSFSQRGTSSQRSSVNFCAASARRPLLPACKIRQDGPMTSDGNRSVPQHWGMRSGQSCGRTISFHLLTLATLEGNANLILLMDVLVTMNGSSDR